MGGLASTNQNQCTSTKLARVKQPSTSPTGTAYFCLVVVRGEIRGKEHQCDNWPSHTSYLAAAVPSLEANYSTAFSTTMTAMPLCYCIPHLVEGHTMLLDSRFQNVTALPLTHCTSSITHTHRLERKNKRLLFSVSFLSNCSTCI